MLQEPAAATDQPNRTPVLSACAKTFRRCTPHSRAQHVQCARYADSYSKGCDNPLEQMAQPQATQVKSPTAGNATSCRLLLDAFEHGVQGGRRSQTHRHMNLLGWELHPRNPTSTKNPTKATNSSNGRQQQRVWADNSGRTSRNPTSHHPTQDPMQTHTVKHTTQTHSRQTHSSPHQTAQVMPLCLVRNCLMSQQACQNRHAL